MQPGTILARQFCIGEFLAKGGMGSTYAAVDLRTSREVVVKVPHTATPQAAGRLVREAMLLARLRHPGIVEYVASGETPAGDPYLVTRRIRGPSLAEQLWLRPLSIPASIDLVAAVAEALAIAHARGVVHRDLKPGNLLLPGADLARVTIIDFGLARTDASAIDLTVPGEHAGTPGYMAPEQIHSLRDADARADIYALGCVLFECVTGRPLFRGRDTVAVLAKILFEQPIRLAELVPEAPRELDDLMARMLAKDRCDRPADAVAFLDELRRLRSGAPPVSRPVATELGRDEQRIAAVILGRRSVDEDAARDAPTVSVDVAAELDRALATLIEQHGGRFATLGHNHFAVTMTGAESATDLAGRAARLALAVAAQLPAAELALAMKRAAIQTSLPAVPGIDRTAHLLSRPAGTGAGRGGCEPSAPRVVLDEVTAALLDGRFEVDVAGDAAVLLGYREHAAAERMLLGRPTPFVGRRRDLAVLLDAWADCQEASRAQAVVVIGDAGGGKSRLAAEAVARIRRDAEPPVAVWTGRGHPIGAGVLAPLAQMIRHEAGLAHDDVGEIACAKLVARVARRLAPAQVERVAVFLGELCAVPFADADRPTLRAARRDPRWMDELMIAAWVELLDAECAAGPLLLVLEDWQWTDPPSVTFIEAALRRLSKRPLLVLALGRPEVRSRFPAMWAGCWVKWITLRPLGEPDARELVVQGLGGEVSASQVRAIVERADGNPLYLEELIRGASHGQSCSDSVLALLDARLGAVPADLRRVLRAASVFGESFWPDAVSVLVGADPAWVAGALAELVERDLLVGRGAAAGADAPYAFRHGLVRDAAYAMLTDNDRRLGHRLAAEWLAQRPGADPMTIAEHHERAGAPARAVHW